VYIQLLQDARFFEFLLQCDRDLAEAVRRAGCGPCRGKLHQADYPRKPRGGPKELDPEFSLRLSFCCAVEGCRCRHTPPSFRFLDRRVYLSAVVVLAAAMRQGSTPTRVRQIRDLVGVSPRTLSRWRTWWRTIFSKSSLWKAARGTFAIHVAAADLPRALLDQFRGDLTDRLCSFLRFLAPLTTASIFGAGFSMPIADPQKTRAVIDKTSR